MQTYWDYTAKERSELTRDQVEDLLKFELMAKGVLKPDAPEYLPETAPELPTRTLYSAKQSYNHDDLLFDSAEKAAQAIALSCGFKVSHYLGGLSLSGCKSGEIEISPIDVVSEADVASHRSALEQAAANKKANEATRNEFQKACKACEQVTSGVWEDWNDQCSRSRQLRRVIDTYKQYVNMSDGDESVALRFLGKAFDRETIETASEWYGEIQLAFEAEPQELEAATP